MAKKKNNNNNEGGEKNENNRDGENKEFMLNIDLHCYGCTSKVVHCVRAFDGVETVKAETNANKLTVKGNVNPLEIQEKLHHKTKKTVNLISPQLNKKDENNNKGKKDSKQDKKKTKEKEAPVMTAVLKLNLHCKCDGCLDKIKKIVENTKGVQYRSRDKQEDLVTVKGTMDVTALAETLHVKLKRPVEVVRLDEKDDNNGGSGCGHNNDGPGENNGGGDSGKKKKGGGDSGGAGNVERNKMDVVYGYGYSIRLGVDTTRTICMHPSNINPNSCSIMCC